MWYNSEFEDPETINNETINNENNNENNNYSIAIISKYNSKLMGINEQASTHWIVHQLVPYSLFFNHINTVNMYLKFYKENSRYVNIHILPIKYEYLDDGTIVAFPKIFWIKIIQRRWKKIMAERKRIINNRTYIKEVIQYQHSGKWSKDNNYLPTLRDMML